MKAHPSAAVTWPPLKTEVEVMISLALKPADALTLDTKIFLARILSIAGRQVLHPRAINIVFFIPPALFF
jgi:hypothetical protein